MIEEKLLSRRLLLMSTLPYFLLLVIAFLSSFGYRKSFFATDEGLYYYEAIRMLHGDVIYRDFFEFVTPGVFLYIGGLMRLFGEHVMPVRYSLGIIYVLETWMVYWIGRRLRLPRWAAFLPPLIFIVDARCQSWWSIQHHSISHFLALLTFCSLLRWVDERKNWQVIAAGLCAGTAVCFTQHVGVVSAAIALFWVVIWPGVWLRLSVGRQAGLLVACICAPILALLGYLAANGAVADAYHSTVQWVMSSYRGYHSEPYYFQGNFQIAQVWKAGLGWSSLREIIHLLLVGYAPLLALAGGCCMFAVRAIRTRGDEAEQASVTRLGVVLSAAGGIFGQVAAQPTMWGIKQNSVLASVIAVYLLLRLSGRLPSLRVRTWRDRSPKSGDDVVLEVTTWVTASRVRRYLGFCSIAIMAGLYGLYVPRLLTAVPGNRGKRHYIVTPFGDLWSANAEFISDLQAVRAYVAAHVPSNDPVYVFYWSPYMYMVLERAPSVPYHGTLPGYHSDSQIRQIVDSIVRQRPAVIVEDRTIQWMLSKPDPRILAYGLDKLQQEPIASAVRDAYEPILQLENFTILVRKGSS